MPNTVVRRPPFRRRGQNWLVPTRTSLRASVTGSGGIVVGGDIGHGAHFVHRQVDSDIVVEVDWDNDGDFDEPEEDITSFVMAWQTQTGRDFPSQLTGRAGPGTFKGLLDNTDDRFSYFNPDSPLSQAPFSLKTGRKLRVRTREAANPDPALLARDRFNRAAGALVATENGLPWFTDADADGPFEINDSQAVATLDGGVTNRSLIDVGVTDYYVQGRFNYQDFEYPAAPGADISNRVGLYLRFENHDNDLFVAIYARGIELIERVAGVATTLDSATVELVDGCTVGVHCVGTDVTVYLDGVALLTGTTSRTGTKVGLRGVWEVQRAPRVDEFHVWDRLPTEVEGILWTGDIDDLQVTVMAGPEKTASLAGKGWLAKAAQQEITPPNSIGPTQLASGDTAYPGKRTGQLVGQTLAAANLLHPPGPIDGGDVLVGGVGLSDGKALDIARQIEETELGFLFETQEGPIGFRDRNTPFTEPHSGTVLSDAPGAQFGYHAIQPYDWKREVVNRVVAGVAPTAPRIRFASLGGGSTGPGVANPADIVVFDAVNDGAVPGDLALVLIASTVRADGEEWITPDGWTSLRDTKDKPWQHIYCKVLAQEDLGTTVRVYNDAASAGGATIVLSFLIKAWYGDLTQGVMMAPHNGVIGNSALVGTADPPTVFPSWGRAPSLFIATRAGMVSIGGASVAASADITPPNGYPLKLSVFTNSATNSFDVAEQIAIRVGNAEIENPSPFGADFSGFIYSESTVLAIRGYAGPLANGRGAQRETVQVDDLTSQDDHNAIRTHTNPANLFQSTADARDYGQLVLARYADDRPIFQVTFWATKSAAYRLLTTRRRVGHRITLVANNQSGLGVDGDFFIESIALRGDHGNKALEVTWELSPVPDAALRPDTEGSELTSGITSTQTEFDVTTTVGDVWINSDDYPSMFPLEVTIGTELIRVTGIAGTSSPQTFTGERSINQVVSSHLAGAAVALAEKWRAA